MQIDFLSSDILVYDSLRSLRVTYTNYDLHKSLQA